MKKEITKEYLCHLGGQKRLEDIKSLNLSNHGLTSLDVDILNQLKTLKSLDISQNLLTCIPDELKLPNLMVLDCTENDLESVAFAKNFKKLKELYFDDNKQLTIDDECIVRVMCPGIKKINDYEELGQLDITIRLYTNQLKPQLEAVWAAKYSEVYGNCVPEEEMESLLEDFITTATRSEIVGNHLSMVKFKEFMIEHISRQMISDINSRTSNYSTRITRGVKSLRDYSRETPMEVDDDKSQVQGHSQRTHTRSHGQRTPSKGQGHSSPNKTAKRKRENENGEEGTPLKVRKLGRNGTPSKNPSTPTKGSGTPDKTPGTPRFTVVKPSTETRLSSVDDYDPEIFLRCHSRGNNPSDDEIKVWKCAFEPRTDKKGETTNMVATCGGNMVCLIDCQTGKVLRRYKDNSKTENFYTLAWTTLEADNKNLKEDVNILAVAGFDGQIKLIQPRQLVMFGVIEGHRCYISSLVFHPKKRNILFSASRDNKIIMWDIKTPDFKTNKIEYSQVATLSLPDTDAIEIVVNPDLDVLVAGCEKSCYAWNIKKCEGKKNVIPHYEFVHPQEEDAEDSSEQVDGIALLSNNFIVSKCVGHSCLYVWDLQSHLMKRNSSATKGVQLRPLVLLEYTPVSVEYVFLTSFKDLVCVGDDKGRVFMYDLKKVIKQKKKGDEILRPSRVLEYPDRNLDNKFMSTMTDISETEDVVVNCVGLSSNREFLVYGTDNNIVAVWRNASKL